MSLISPDLSCNNNITGNTDVGGPGILGSFIFTAWLTIALAGVLAWDEVVKTYRAWQDSRRRSSDPFPDLPPGERWIGSRTNSSFRAYIASHRDANEQPPNPPPPIQNGDPANRPENSQSPRHRHRVGLNRAGFAHVQALHRLPNPPVLPAVPKVHALLGTLCDLQAITGLGIVVSGMTQWGTITFYHEQLVSSYYSMTLNSFWAARVNYMSWDVEASGAGALRLLMRRLVIIAASAANITWQIYVYWRENESSQWPEADEDDVPDGRCYRFLDRSNPRFALVFWGLGQFIFTLALCLCLSRRTNWVNGRVLVAIELVALWLQGWLVHFRNLCYGPQEAPSPTAQRLGQRGGAALMVVACGFAVALWFLFRQLLDVWSYGEGFYPFSWLVYVALLIYNTWGVASLMELNRSMVADNELATWGFGQVLPIVILLSIAYTAVDVFAGSSHDKTIPDGEAFELYQQRRGVEEFYDAESPVH